MAQTIASGQIFNQGTMPVTAMPVTMACWFNAPNITTQINLMSLGDFDLNHYYTLEASGTVAGDPVRAGASAGGSAAYGTTASGFSASTWTHACGVFTSSTSRTAYINGGNSGSGTTSRSPTGIDYIALGNIRISNAWSSTATVTIAEAAIWRVALSAAEIESLAKGFRPDSIRPQSLVFYAPLVREIIDLRGGLALTTSGTNVATHPRIL